MADLPKAVRLQDPMQGFEYQNANGSRILVARTTTELRAQAS